MFFVTIGSETSSVHTLLPWQRMKQNWTIFPFEKVVLDETIFEAVVLSGEGFVVVAPIDFDGISLFLTCGFDPQFNETDDFITIAGKIAVELEERDGDVVILGLPLDLRLYAVVNSEAEYDQINQTEFRLLLGQKSYQFVPATTYIDPRDRIKVYGQNTLNYFELQDKDIDSRRGYPLIPYQPPTILQSFGFSIR